jgi:S-disulfanyl-L-cysteine oxidoreductase SoxD
MRSFLKRLAAVLVLSTCVAYVTALAQARQYSGIGKTPAPEEIHAVNITVNPSGDGLPPGSGTAKQGGPIFQAKCALCHGQDLQGTGKRPALVVEGEPAFGPPLIYAPRLEGGRGMPLWSPDPQHRTPLTIGSYYPFATTIWDYINRAMPQYQGRTLTADQVYALTAFLLYKNGIIKEDYVMDRETLPAVVMPNRHGFIPDKLEDIGDIEGRGCWKTYGTCP